METQSKRLLILLERINNHNIHTSPDSDMDDDLMNEMHDCIDMLKANEDKQPEQAHCHIADISNPLINDLKSQLIIATNEIIKDSVIGDNYTRLDNKIKRISYTLRILNGC